MFMFKLSDTSVRLKTAPFLIKHLFNSIEAFNMNIQQYLKNAKDVAHCK